MTSLATGPVTSTMLTLFVIPSLCLGFGKPRGWTAAAEI
jgi:hypothetical protein